MKRAICAALVFFAVALAEVACGGKGGGDIQPVITVSISPTSTTLNQGQTQQFTATVTGSTNTQVAWTATGGTVSNSGLYTAGNTAGSFSVTITSAADSTKSATAKVTVNGVSVSISPTSATLAYGQTQQFTATVTGSTNTQVAWTATGGTVSNSGLYTAGNTAGSFSVTITSAADSTKSATAGVTVNAPPAPVISSMNPFLNFCNSEYGCGGFKDVMDGQNFESSDQLTITPPLSGGSVAVYIGPTEIDLYPVLDSPTYNPGQFTIVDKRKDGSGSSNAFHFGFLNNRNLVAEAPSGDLFQLDVKNGVVHHYNPSGTYVGDVPNIHASWRAIAIDNTTGYIVLASSAGAIMAVYDQSGNVINGDNNPSEGTVDLDAQNGIACVLRHQSNIMDCLNLTVPGANPISTAAVFNDPCSVAMGTLGVKTMAFVYSCGNKQIAAVDTGTMTVTGTLALSVTQEPSVLARGRLIYFPASGTLAFLSPTDTAVVLVNASTMAVIKTVALTGTACSAFADQAHGKLVVVYNPNLGGMNGAQVVPVELMTVDVASGSTATLTNPAADILPTGGRITSDGTSIALGERDRLVLSPNR